MMPDEFMCITPTNPPDAAHEQLCTAVLDCYGYTLVSDVLCLVLSCALEDGNVCRWHLHTVVYAGDG